ncbi:MAG: hypothetical protein AAF242_05595 [Bacteroidota bacterium]
MKTYASPGEITNYQEFFPNGGALYFQESKAEKDPIRNVEIYFPNGQLKLVGKAIYGVAIDYWKCYHENGLTKWEGAYHTINHPKDTSYIPLDLFVSKKWEYRGLKTGLWQAWDKNGVKIFEAAYEVKDGKVIEKVIYSRD